MVGLFIAEVIRSVIEITLIIGVIFLCLSLF
jgi:hypothetical protein